MSAWPRHGRLRWVRVAVGVVALAVMAGCSTPDDAAGPATATVAGDPESVRATPPPPVTPTTVPPAPETVAVPAPEPAPGPADQVASAEERVLALANEARAAEGLAPLARSSDMDAVALAWSTHLATGGLDLAHNPDYSTQIPGGWSQAAENVGWMGPSGMSADEVAAQIHASWMASPGHHANLMNPALTHIGIGVVTSAENGWYLTQDFAAY